MKTLEEQIRGKCRHFNGLIFEECNARTRYDKKRKELDGKYLYPCFRENRLRTCVKRSFYSDEEVKAKAEESRRLVGEYMTLIARRECPNCHGTWKGEQIGQCVYCELCGYRLYQGRLSLHSPSV